MGMGTAGPRLLTSTINLVHPFSTLFQFACEFREKLVSIRFGVRPDERDAHVCKINSHIDEARLLAKREEGRGSDDGSIVAAESGMDLLSIREMLPDASGVRIARLGLRRG